MPGSCFADRLGEFFTLTAAEHEALNRLEERERALRRGISLVRENDRTGELYVLRRGIMMSYLLLDDGSRQILRFLYPGDMIGLGALAYARSAETVAAVTDCMVAPFDRTALTALIVDHPRLAAAMLALHQIDGVAATDRLAALGRTCARGRVAAILLEVRDRARRIDPALADCFPLHLTQEEIGDATGLTAVHVNRMFRRLEEDRLIARGAGRVTLLNEPALARAANYIDRSAGIDMAWLPPQR